MSENPTEQILAAAAELGFQRASLAPVRLPEADLQRFRDWLEAGHGADMEWLEKRAAERADPRLIVEGAASVLSLGMFYLPTRDPEDTPRFDGTVARYARGRDYHQLVNKRLKKLRRKIEAALPGANTYVNVDTGPILERSYAREAGLGWIGHNTCVIDPEGGSYLFLAEVLIDRELPPGPTLHKRMPDCGTCTACLDACPTDAFTQKGVLDSRLCISYHTIENRGSIPEELRPKFGDLVFGCDICQEVCPWNREPQFTIESDFEPRPGHGRLDLKWILASHSQDIEDEFLGSPLRRAKGRGLKRNALVALGNSGDADAIALIEEFLKTCDDELLREHAEWALERLRPTHPTT